LEIPVSCNLDCGGSCPLLATVENGRLKQIADNPAGGRYMTGCVRGRQMARVLYAPDRLLRPLIRRGARGSGEFREAGWDEALDLVAERLVSIRDRRASASVLRLGGSGSCRGALHDTARLTQRFLAMFGGFTDITGSYSANAVEFVLPYVFGTCDVGLDAATLQSTNLIVLWGANVADCRMGPDLYAYIREARERGVEVVAIDPRRTRTVDELATRWIPIRPGTDGAMMLAVLHSQVALGLVDRQAVDRVSVGFEGLEAYLLGAADGQPKSAEWAETICGTPPGAITHFARLYSSTRPVALIPGLSIQRTINGEDTSRLAVALQVVTGNLGVRGGSSGALAWSGLPGPRVGSIEAPPNPAASSVPVYHWPDVVLQGRKAGFPSDVSALYNVGGNFLVQGSDVRKNVRAFECVEFSVTHDHFMTPTARYSDVVLPTTTFLERDDIVRGSGNFVFFSNQAVPAQGEARNDYQVFRALASRLGFEERFSEGRDEEAWLQSFLKASELPDHDAFRRTGIYFGLDQYRTAFEKFVADPVRTPLGTPSGRVELAPVAYEADTGFAAVPQYRALPESPGYPLRLVTPKSRYRVHSQNNNIPWFNEKEPPAIWIHPGDAVARGILEGQEVRVSSPEGSVRIPARLTSGILSGVVCMLEGVWPCLDPDGVDTAGSPNMLTSTVPTMPSRGSRTHSVWVEIKPA